MSERRNLNHRDKDPQRKILGGCDLAASASSPQPSPPKEERERTSLAQTHLAEARC
jgi:hypothetical protein